MVYQDFEIELITRPDGVHQVNVLHTPAGETRQDIAFGLSDDALRQKLIEMEEAVRYQPHLSAEQKRARAAAVQAFGHTLFHALLNDNLKSLYDQSRLLAKQQGAGLRLKLRIESPLLAAVPWELLYDGRFAEFLATSRQISLVRYVPLPRPAHATATKPPLHVLGIVAAPQILPPLDVALEKQQVAQALQPLTAKGLATLTWLEEANWRSLLRAMRQGPWHVLHYVGHSDFDTAEDEGYLSLTDAQGQEDRLYASKLGNLLADHGALRLVLLNSCKGARLGQDIYASIATTLVQKGLPAVIGMQYDISNEAAIELAQMFYEMLAENAPMEAALAEARKAISLAVDEGAEWGTPAFYTHAPHSVLFDLPPAPPILPSGDESMNQTPMTLIELYDWIEPRYNESELRQLCFRLGVKYEDLGGSGRADNIRELVLHCQRRSLLAQLQDMVTRPPQPTTPAPHSPPTADVEAWVEVLLQSPTMQNRDTRLAVLAELPAPIRTALNENLPTLNSQLRNLVQTCQNYPNGLAALVSAVRLLEGNSIPVLRLETLL